MGSSILFFLFLTYVINNGILFPERKVIPVSRPPKCRRVCHFPQNAEFFPAQWDGQGDVVILTLDEYETIRLIDREGLSQEQCSQRMQVARTTAQKIYDSARHKLSQALVDGLPLRIEGGAYRLCDGGEPCNGSGCFKRNLTQIYSTKKGETIMRIAVTYENGEIFQHFGHTENFKVYDVEDGKVVSSQVVSTNGSGHGALAEVLHTLHVDTLICGGIGGGAQNALASVGIRLFGGVSGNADAAVDALISGNLTYNPDVKCDHHGEHHHGEGHTCGSHGCGGHSCGNH